MTTFLDTRGKTKIAIGICARCSCKMPYADMLEDPNFPGLWVCKDDLDNLDPYRLPARESEDISLDHPRPDVSLTDTGPQLVLGDLSIQGITQIQEAVPWQPNTFYKKGQSVFVRVNSDPSAPAIYLVCLGDGWSGTVPPTEGFNGVVFHEGAQP